MSKATRLRQQNAREKIAAQRAAARRAEVRKRALITTGSVIVVAFIVIKASGNHNSPSSNSGGVTGTALPASVAKDITTVPASTLNSVGVGSVPAYMTSAEGGQPAIGKISDK